MGLWLMYYVIILFYNVIVQHCLLVHLNIIPNKLEHFSVLSFNGTVIIIYYSIAFLLFFFFFSPGTSRQPWDVSISVLNN